jgi:hypothetical protein
MSQAEPQVAGSREPGDEPERPWELPGFWRGVEDELTRVDPGEFALFALPVRVSPDLEHALWLRLGARLGRRGLRWPELGGRRGRR